MCQAAIFAAGLLSRSLWALLPWFSYSFTLRFRKLTSGTSYFPISFYPIKNGRLADEE